MRRPADLSAFRIYLRAFRETHGFWPHLAAILLLGLLEAPLGLLVPLPMKVILDSVLGAAPAPAWLDPALFGLTREALFPLAIGLAVLFSVLTLGHRTGPSPSSSASAPSWRSARWRRRCRWSPSSMAARAASRGNGTASRRARARRAPCSRKSPRASALSPCSARRRARWRATAKRRGGATAPSSASCAPRASSISCSG